MDKNIEKVKSIINAQMNDINALNGINSLILSVCLVDTLAGFYSGYKGELRGNRDRFKKFTEKYLPQHDSYLYEIRCSLAHSFSNTVSNFMFVDSKEYSNVFSETKQILDWKVFDIAKFKVELKNAIDNYFTDLIGSSNAELLANFNIRFTHCVILDDGVIPTVRNMKGDIVKNYNDLDNLGDLPIKLAIFSPTKVKK